MLTRSLQICLSMLLVFPVLADEPAGAGDQHPASVENIRALRQGGHVIYMRHAISDVSKPDRAPDVDLNDCATQRPLSDEGRSLASRVGQSIRTLGIPLGETFVSPYCRTKETATLAFGKQFTVTRGLIYSSNLTEQAKAPIIKEFRELLSRPVAPGSNRILVSHSTTLMDATNLFPKPEGVVLIFRPDGKGGYVYVATIRPDDWGKLISSAR